MYRKYQEPAFMPVRDEMQDLLWFHSRLVLQSETAALAESLGRVCAADIRAKRTLPNTSVSQLDGIGVRYSDFAAGLPDTSLWRENEEFYFSNTGVALREGYDTVIPVEDMDYAEGRLSIACGPEKQGAYVGAAGTAVRDQQVLVRKGTRIMPKHIGLLAAGGVMEAEVLRKPVVAVIPTGDELAAAEEETPKGKNAESSSHMLAAYITLWGGHPLRCPIIRDDTEQVLSALKKAVAEADVTILIGGSSKGTMDYSMEALRQTGQAVAEELGHGPGKHTSLFMAGDKIIMGFPGPFMGAQLVAELYLRTVLDRLLLQPRAVAQTLDVILEQDLGRYEIDFVEVLHIFRRDGAYYAESVWKRAKSWADSIEMTNGWFYHKKGLVCSAGDCVRAELVVPPAYLPEGGSE